MDFDERYPAMFQPGGDRLPAPITVPVPMPVPVPAAAPAPAPAPPMPLDPPSGSAGNLLEESQDTPAAEDADGSRIPASAATRPPWSPRTWAAGVAAALLCLAAGLFALTATTWIPASRMTRPEDYLGMSVLPWGWLLLGAAAPLVVAGLGMLALMLFLGSRQFPNNTRTLRAGVAAIAAAALVLAVLGIFFDQLFPGQMQITINPASPQWPVPWQAFLTQAMASFAVLGLTILAVLAVLRPAPGDPDTEPPVGAPSGTSPREGAPSNSASSNSAPSAKAAWLVGLVFLGFAAFALFAQLMFPLSMAVQTVVQGDYTTQTTPWPQRIVTFAAPLTLAGAGSLLWGVLIGTTSQRPQMSLPPAAT